MKKEYNYNFTKKFKPLKIIRIRLIRTKKIEIKFAILKFFVKL